MKNLAPPQSLEVARQQIAELIETYAEWFHVVDDAPSQALRRSELDIAICHGALILSCWTEGGTRSWKIRGWKWNGEKLMFRASRRMGAERPVIELVPRAAATALAATVKAARQARCDLLAQLASQQLLGTRIERVTL